ncbi:hypothetical protein Arub01_40140 [Actinomadura rubrobrunea]|uniref:Uncharacterized protein n=1 Tax=Actinomadura rubrobrunea TaxID=115335 RepID=A0A9W6PWM6_9ACTN|nr:hypothetical protein Arub01_40140 [Actinomadura rubrobrunea]
MPRIGECGARCAIWSGSMLEAYAAYSATAAKRTQGRAFVPGAGRVTARYAKQWET